MSPWSRAWVTLLSSTNQLSVTGSAAALGLALVLGAADAAILALGAADAEGVGELPPNPPEQAPTTKAARIPMTRSRVGVVVIVLLQDVEDRRTPAVSGAGARTVPMEPNHKPRSRVPPVDLGDVGRDPSRRSGDSRRSARATANRAGRRLRRDDGATDAP
jgi:hypothetical protein